MTDLKQEKTAEEQLAEMKADRYDSMIFHDHPAFSIAERAFRRGFVHALNEIIYYAKNVPPEFRAWANAYRESCDKWRSDFKNGRASKTTVSPPPHIIPYRKEIIHETEFTQPCPDCQGYGHPVERDPGWRVLCTCCTRRTPYFKRKKQALTAWNKLTKSAPPEATGTPHRAAKPAS